ncbi:GGDEF domain-containing protein [Massilia antarctica]|uniref:diguanylate cyclase n=1 Tax=Massilia antarctica TaxID=2765360 RepID=A0AA48WEZ4_9BURK|nr:GGDEF domain-containing protein [Massilia antarctica]QPI51083.1 GGDEF domain-containing protein [Massilia antarctica]
MIGLIVLTAALLIWQHFGMERIMEFSAASGRPVELVDDRLQQGGSVARLTRRPDALIMDCDLRLKFEWPYCRFLFILSKNEFGVDLSEFDSISFDISYDGPGDHTVRIFLRNFEPGMSTLDDYMSQKVNEVHVIVPAKGIVKIPVKVLRAAPWWTDMRHVPFLHADMRIDNVTSVDLSIGARDTAGHHRVELRSLKFHGKLISQNRLLLILMGMWIGCAVVWLGLALRHSRSQLTNSTTRLALLSKVNEALELETRELAGQAYSDPLTQVLNREGLRAALMERWQHPDSSHELFAVIFVDIDHFKKVNDTHGHGVGDDVLCAFAAAIQHGIRASDKLARWGGEEFLIICSGTKASDAHLLAEKLREGLNSQIWPGGLRITASFGVTALQPGEVIGEAIKRADGALYQAKSNGRNCVRVA